MRKLKSSVKTAVVSTVALTSTAAIIYAVPNLVTNGVKTTNIGNKLKLDVEKIDSDTVKVSIDNVQDIPKSIQFSVKLDGNVKLTNGESSIKDLIKPQVQARLANNEYQVDSNDILTDYTYNQDSNTIDVLITSENSLPKFGNKIEVFELDLKASNKLTKQGGTTYKVVPNNEDEYKYLSVTNKEYNNLGVVSDDETLSLNTAPTITTSKQFIKVVEGEKLELTAQNLGITIEDADKDEVTLEVKDLSQSNKPVITEFMKKTPGLYNLECVAVDSTGEKSEPITLQVYVDYDNVTEEPTITRNGQNLETNITINGGELFKPLENVKAVDAKGRELEVQVTTDKELNLDPENDTTYVLTYTAADTYGNKTIIKVNLDVIANKAPIISGVKNHTLKVGENFDPRKDVVVTDEDNDIELVVDSNVNTSIAGEYKVSYSATDSKGKTTRVQSTVTVNPKTSTVTSMPMIVAKDTAIKINTEFKPLDLVRVYNTKGEDITSNVKIEVLGDTVDTSKENTYKVTYKVTSQNGGSVTKTITVNVVKALVPAKEIKINDKFEKLYVGNSREITATISEDADVRDIEWSVSNSDVLSLEVKGNSAKVVAKGKGKAVITATTTDGSNISDRFEVIVEEYKGSTINSIPMIFAKDTTIKIGSEFNPLSIATAYDKEDKDLTSSIEVIENNVDTTKEGNYTVRYKVEDKNGASVTKTITVSVVKALVPAKEIKINDKFEKLYVGNSREITATISEDADVRDIEWSVSNSDVLSLEVKGNSAKVVAKGKGKAVITATTTDGSNISDRFEVIVEEYKGSTINSIPMIFAKDTTIKLGEEFNPLSIVTAYDKEDKDLTSSIKVIENNVDTTKEGNYTVKYKVEDKNGASVTKTITVNVVKEIVLANKINISNKFDNLYLGASKEINASVNEEADIKGIKWSVSDNNILDIEVKENTVKITAKGEGKAVVTATTTDGSNISDRFEVTVKDYIKEGIISDTIMSIIDPNIVTPVSGEGSENSPVELQVKCVKEDEFENFVKKMKELNSKIVDTREEEGFTVYKIKLTKPTNIFTRLLRISVDDYFVELKIDNSLENANQLKEIVSNTLKNEQNNNIPNDGNSSTGNGSSNDDISNNDGDSSIENELINDNTTNNNGNMSTENGLSNNDITDNNENTSIENPKSGDSSMLGYLGLGAIASGALFISLGRNRKEK